MSTKPSIYLETTIPSYLTAWPSRDLVMAANQAVTREWWTNRSGDFDVYVSQIVVKECSAGDPDAAQRRLEFLKPFPRLNITEEAEQLAAALIDEVPLPQTAQADALHIAVAAVHRIKFLHTWNCTHIANASLRSEIERVCRSKNHTPPVVCTPQELLSHEELHA